MQEIGHVDGHAANFESSYRLMTMEPNPISILLCALISYQLYVGYFSFHFLEIRGHVFFVSQKLQISFVKI
jgi:hypothetical protein